jgi:four helix bundle protein
MESGTARKISHYRDLRVFQRGYELALKIHKVTRNFPIFERRELGSQLRRAAASIPINIAEGYGRKRSADDFKRFLVIAMGSSNEVSVELALAKTSVTSTRRLMRNCMRSAIRSDVRSTS